MAPMRSTPLRRAIKVFFLLFCLICIACVVFWKTLISLGVQWILNGGIASDGSKPIQYEQMSWEGETLCLSGLKREDRGYAFCIEQLRIHWNINWKEFRLEPCVALIHPQMTVFGNESPSSGGSLPFFLLPHERVKIRLEAELGTLHFSEEPDLVFYFSWIPGTAWESIGMLTLSYDSNLEASPVFRAEIHKQDDVLSFSFHMREKECSQIAPLLAFLQFPWQPFQGDVELTGFGKWGAAGKLQELSCQGSARTLHLRDLMGESSLYFEQLDGEVRYPSQSMDQVFWKNIQAHVTLEGGEFSVCPEWSLKKVQGTCHVQPDHNPEVKLDGTIVTQHTSLALAIEGQGSAHEDGTFWIDVNLKSDASDAPKLQTYFSYCSPVKDHYICQVTCERAEATHLRTFFQIAPQFNFNQIDWKEGSLQGKMTLTIGQGELKEVSIDELIVNHMRCAFSGKDHTASAELIKGDLKLSRTSVETWDLVHSTMEVKDGEVFSASHLNAHLKAAHNQLLESSIEGFWGSLFATVSIHDPSHEQLLDFSLKGSLTPFFDLAMDDPQTRVEGAIRIHDDGYYCEGNLFIQEEPIAFGMSFILDELLVFGISIPPKIELIQGWMRAESLPESAYLPYLHMWAPDLHLGGNLSLSAHIDKQKIECSLEGGAFTVTHPSFDTRSLETIGPATICYDRSTERMTGRCGLKCSWLHSPVLGLSLEGVEGFVSVDSLFSQQNNCRTWNVQGGVTQCTLPLTQSFVLTGGKWEWSYSENHWRIHNGYAKVQLPEGNSYHLYVPECSGGASGAAIFDIKLQEASKEIARCKGTLKVAPISNSNKIAFHLESEHVKFKDTLIPHLVVNGHKIGSQWVIDHVRTKDLNLKTSFNFQNSGIEFTEIQGNWKGYVAKAKGKYLYETQRLFCRIDSLQGDLGALTETCTGRFSTCMNAEWDLAALTVKGEATCAIDLKFPLSLLAKSETPTQFSYSLEEGWNLQGLGLQLYLSSTAQHLGALKCSSVRGNSKGLQVTQAGFSFSPELVKRGVAAHLFPETLSSICSGSYLEGSSDVTISSSGFSLQGKLNDGIYQVQDHPFPLEQIFFSCDPALLSCRFKVPLGEKPLFAKVQIDRKGEPFGIVKILDHPQSEGITALFKTQKGNLYWEKIHGNACGLTCDLIQHVARRSVDSHLLTGTIALNGSQLVSYLTTDFQEKWKALNIGSGFAFKGEIAWNRDSKRGYHVNGALVGSQCELFGCSFDHLQVDLDATQEHVHLANLKMEDEAGILAIKQIDVRKDPHRATWGFAIPHAQVKEWRPSLHKKNGQTSAHAKPFVIKNLTLSEIRGTVSDPLTWEGQGTLNFTNAFKKETTFLDLPLEIVKDFGLDPGLLTPVQGEVDIELRGDKFYLVHLKNAFSDKKRSQFFLSPEKQVSYIGLDGKLSIDLKMKQDVVLKLTEAFTLKVRGTVDQPRYGLHY